MKPVTLALERVLLSLMNSAWFTIYRGDRDLAVGDKVVLLLNEMAEDYVGKALESKGPEKLSPIVYISTVSRDSDALFKRLAEIDPDKYAFVKYHEGVASCLEKIVEARETLERCEYDNPFKVMLQAKENISTIKEERIVEFIWGLFQAAKADGQSQQLRMQLFHGFASQEEKLQQYWAHQCCLERMYSGLLGIKAKRALWIENKPHQVQELDNVLRICFGLHIDIKEKPAEIDDYYDSLKSGSLDVDYDYVFLDMYLDKETKRNGRDYLELFIAKYPHIPAFVISGSEDFDLIADSIRSGAEAYVMKQYSFSLPFHIRKYHERIGRIVQLIKSPDLSRHLIGNIRYWRFFRDALWHGDKCYHMINHGYQHAENNWRLLNQFFPVLNKKIEATDEEIYALCAATWLHDIGHAGNSRYGEPDKIRDNHAVISAEYILRHPELYRLFGYSGLTMSPNVYASEEGKTCLEFIRERLDSLGAQGKALSAERILCLTALMCIFHSSKFPIDVDEAEVLDSAGKSSPEAHEGRRHDGTVIHLSLILDGAKRKNQLLQVVTAFRLVDALDHNKNRVGDRSTKSIRIEACQRDKKFQLKRLCDEANGLVNSDSSEMSGVDGMGVLYEDILKAVSEGLDISSASNSARALARSISDAGGAALNYISKLDYIVFLHGQESHYDLHEAIDEIRIDARDERGMITLDIKIVTNKDKDELSEIKVRDKNNPGGRSFEKYLLGDRDKNRQLLTDDKEKSGYLGKELVSSIAYFDGIVDIRHHKAGIYDLKGDLLYPEEALGV